MSSKDYIAIGNVLRGQWAISEPIEKGTVWCLTLSIADKFKQDNERFDRVKFYYHVFGTDQFSARKQCKWSQGVEYAIASRS